MNASTSRWLRSLTERMPDLIAASVRITGVGWWVGENGEA
jgi:hypothetical protein